MKILVVGATGRVGQILMSYLKEAGNEVYGTSRKKSAEKDMIVLNLHAPVKEMEPIISGFEVVYFVAGSRGKDLLQTDLFGAVKVMQAAKSVGVQRYIQLSSAFALEPERWNIPALADLTDYNIAKYFSDNYLTKQSGLNYTIVQPGSLIEETGTGKIEISTAQSGPNPIPDVAAVLAKVLEHENTIGKVIIMHGGNENIDTALENLK